MNSLIINVALTGMVTTKEQNVALPVTPDEIATNIRDCYNAGATIFHIHARDKNGQPTWKRDIYEEIIDKARALVPNAIICGSTSGRNWSELEKRMQVLNCDIDMASLTLGSLNFPTGASVNEPRIIKRLALRMKQNGIIPELEIFDLGMLDYAHYLIDKDLLRPPYYFNFLLGSLGTLSAKQGNLLTLIDNLPADAIWAATGIGRFQFEVNCWAIALGGHVRVGLEDWLWIDSDKQIPATNVSLVERLVRAAKLFGRKVAITEQVRAEWKI